MISIAPLRALPCDAIGAQSVVLRKGSGSGSVSGSGIDRDRERDIDQLHPEKDQQQHNHQVWHAEKMNTAAMLFTKNSSFIWRCMVSFVADFRPQTWAYQGPHLVSRVYFRNYRNDPEVRKINILKKDVFYPLGIDINKEVKHFFTVPLKADDTYITGDTTSSGSSSSSGGSSTSSSSSNSSRSAG